jgi:hypothetical protein
VAVNLGLIASQISGHLGPSVQYYFERMYNSTKTGSSGRGVRDSAGNCYFIVSDYTNGTNGYYATAVFKTDNTGAIQWSKYWTNQGYNFDIGIDNSGNLYIGTQQNSRLTAYIKMNTTTGAQIGSGVYYSVGVTYRGGVAIDTDGNIWGAGSVNPNNNLTGPHKVPANLTSNMSVYGLSATYFDGIATAPNGDVISLGTSPANNYYPILVSTTKGGSFNWAKVWGNAYSSGGPATLATDSSSNIYVACWIADSGQTGAYGFVMKFNSSGTLQWQKKVDLNTSTGQYIYGVAVDTAGNVYAVGQDSSSPVKGIIIKFNSSGVVQWQRSLTNTELLSVSVLSTGELLITGGWKSLSSGGATQPLAIRVPTDGSKTGTYTVGGTSVVYASSSYTISDAGFTIGTYANGWANTTSFSPNSYTPTINDYSATQEVVTI